MYDSFSADYDRFVDWPGRLAAELPFVERQLKMVRARRVLDAACGTGMHAIALAQRGYRVAGADLSAGMVRRARKNAVAVGTELQFEAAGLGQLTKTFITTLADEEESSGFDAVLCLGNSLPHVLAPKDLAAALADFAACLRPGGLLLIQNRNFDAVLTHHQRWMEPQSRREGEAEWVFLRFYDFEPVGTLTFNLVTLERGPASPDEERIGQWSQRVTSTELWPLRQDELIVMLKAAGFGEIACWGDMQSAAFEPDRSPNLVVTTHRLAQ